MGNKILVKCITYTKRIGENKVMNILLIFFALPIATILLAIVLQKILKSPILVAIIFFAIYLIVTFAAFDSDFLIVAILLTILAYNSSIGMHYM